MFNIFGSKKILGVDLGSKNIKIAEIEKYKNSFILTNYIIIELEGGERISSLLETSQIYEENLSKILENGFKEFKIKDVVYSVSIFYYFYTNFSLPYIPPNALKNAINFEYRKYIPVGYEKFQIEWRNIKHSPFNLEGQDKWLIFFTAIPESYLNKIKNISQLAKVRFQKAYPEFLTLEPFFKENKENIILIDIGYSYSYAVLIKENQVINAKKFNLTTKNIIDTLMNLLSVGHQEAEDFFIKKGFQIAPEELDLKKALGEIIDNFSSQVLSLKESWEATFGTKISLIYLTGGLSLAKGLLDVVSTKIPNISFAIFNPLEKNIIPGDNIQNRLNGSVLVQAMGSCLKFFLS
jgi:Tfp pilus assembly PilM family ATPase